MSTNSALQSTQIGHITGGCSHLYQFKIPKTKSVDFNLYFKQYLTDTLTNEFISTLTQKRIALIRELTSSSNADIKLLIVDEYLKLLHKLLYSLNQQPPVAINGIMSFEWSGPITSNEEYYKSNDLMYEMIMVMYTKAIIHSMIASNYSMQSTSIANAAQQFIYSANIMDNIANNLLPKWVNRSPNHKQQPPAEIQANICNALTNYFKASAQQMTICKALIKDGGSAHLLISKLCLGLKSESESAINNIKSNAEYQNKVESDFLIHLKYQNIIFSSLAYFYLGKSFFDETKIGKSITCYNISYSLLQEQTSKKFDFHSNGFPKLIGRLSHLNNLIIGIKHCILSHKQPSEKENNLLYFQDVSKEISVSEMPIGILVLKTSPFIFPGDDSIVLFVKEAPKPGVFNSIMSAFTYNGNTTTLPTPSAPQDNIPVDSRPRSDSEIAKEFQRRINAGENI